MVRRKSVLVKSDKLITKFEDQVTVQRDKFL